jgi:hypothetical protein
MNWRDSYPHLSSSQLDRVEWLAEEYCAAGMSCSPEMLANVIDRVLQRYLRIDRVNPELRLSYQTTQLERIGGTFKDIERKLQRLELPKLTPLNRAQRRAKRFGHNRRPATTRGVE